MYSKDEKIIMILSVYIIVIGSAAYLQSRFIKKLVRRLNSVRDQNAEMRDLIVRLLDPKRTAEQLNEDLEFWVMMLKSCGDER
jgi:hypothetical protein